jgi:hypothetical protein
VKLFDQKFGENFLTAVPLLPGVYRYFDSSGELIYVGKAIRLRRRLQNYRNARRLKSHRKMRAILQKAERLEFEVCSDHAQACLLELEEIRLRRPRFNVASAYSFLYPSIGVKALEGTLELFLTSQAEVLTENRKIRWHGVYRSRSHAREFFVSLNELLVFVGHPESRLKTRDALPRGVWRKAYRTFPQDLALHLDSFLRGENVEFLSELSLRLLENAGARARRDEVQAGLKRCLMFWNLECRRLNEVRRSCGFSEYPVPQHCRDELFLRKKLGLAFRVGDSGRGNVVAVATDFS